MEIKTNLRITLGQADIVWENPVRNRHQLEMEIRQLKGVTDIIILPETFTTGFSTGAIHLAEDMQGDTMQWMKRLSFEVGAAIGGSLLIKTIDSVTNRFVFVQADGAVSFYDKRHLFSIGGESKPVSRGNERVIVDFSGWSVALYICYDLRFPVWCRNRNDTDLMIFTANWPSSRIETWNLLLRARAIENQVFVAGINRTGTDGMNIYYSGGSKVINSRGEVCPEIETKGINWPTYEISMTELLDFREKFPVCKDADDFLLS